jgi:hypothetical protein
MIAYDHADQSVILNPQPLTVQILNSVLGNGPVVPCVTLNQASAAYRAFIDQNGLGSSEAGRCVIRQGRKVVAHVSYNGKVWPGANYHANTQPIYTP